MQKRSSHLSKVFVMNSRIHGSSDGICFSASTVNLSFQRDLRSLSSYSVPNDLWHFILSENLNPVSQKAWETANDGTKAVNFDQLMVFLNNRVRSLALVERSQRRPHKPEREQQIFLTEKNRSHKECFYLP